MRSCGGTGATCRCVSILLSARRPPPNGCLRGGVRTTSPKQLRIGWIIFRAMFYRWLSTIAARNACLRLMAIRIRRLDHHALTSRQGMELCIRVGVRLNGLHSGDIHIECLLGQAHEGKQAAYSSCHLLAPVAEEHEETIYELKFTPAYTGLVGYKLRAYPYHKLLCHHLETGFMKWV